MDLVLNKDMKTFCEYLKTLSEMPMANYRFKPYDKPLESPSSGYSDVDKKLLSSDKTINELKRVLARSTGHNFNILMLEFPSLQKQQYRYYVEDHCKENNIPIEGHITFAKNSATGDPLKSWMILHTVAHAMTDNDFDFDKEMKALLKEIGIAKLRSHGSPGYYADNAHETKDMLARIFKFKSAQRTTDRKIRKLEVRDLGEMVHELIAEFLWHGHIRVQVPKEDDHDDEGAMAAGSVRHLKWKFDPTPMVKKIEEAIKVNLDGLVGKIIIDYY